MLPRARVGAGKWKVGSLPDLAYSEQRARLWMKLALAEAGAAAAAGEVPIGAVVVRGQDLVSAARNRTIELVDPTAHAEVLALRYAAKKIGNYRLQGCDLYVTIEPCAMCIGAAVWARISRLTFGCKDEKSGAAGSLYNLATDKRLNHTIELCDGVLEDECRLLMQEFFRERR